MERKTALILSGLALTVGILASKAEVEGFVSENSNVRVTAACNVPEDFFHIPHVSTVERGYIAMSRNPDSGLAVFTTRAELPSLEVGKEVSRASHWREVIKGVYLVSGGVYKWIDDGNGFGHEEAYPERTVSGTLVCLSHIPKSVFNWFANFGENYYAAEEVQRRAAEAAYGCMYKGIC